MAIPKSMVSAEPGTPGTASSSNLHKPQAAYRGFVPRGLSYAKRRPKLFTEADRRLPTHSGLSEAGLCLTKTYF